MNRDSLDPLQADAAAAVAGDDRLVLVIGPAGAGKTRMLTAAADDLHAHGRVVFAVAPTAKAARTVERDTGIPADTVAKLLHEWQRTDRPPLPEFHLPAGTTLVVDEAGMLSTPALHQLVTLAERNGWRLALVGDPRQLQGVGRGGLFAELCANGRVEQLERLHRFTHRWEAAASLQAAIRRPRRVRRLRGPRPDRPRHASMITCTASPPPGSIITNRAAASPSWPRPMTMSTRSTEPSRTPASPSDISTPRLRHGSPPANTPTSVTSWRLAATTAGSPPAGGEPVRNRDTWTVTGINDDGSITVSHRSGHGDVTLPADYVQ